MDHNKILSIVVEGLAPVVSTLESYSYLGTNSHFVKLPQLDAAIQPVADSLGMELTLIKYTLSLFLVYPFSIILYSLPNKNLKHLFSLAIGLSLVQWVFGPDWIHSFFAAAGTYLICLIAPKKYVAQFGFLFVMGYMTAAHAYRMYVSYLSGVFDFTGTQMVLTMKLTSFAYNFFDGTADRKRVFPDTPYSDKRVAKVYGDRQRFAIRSLPNPLEFFGYVYCFTCIMAGPAFEYNDYVRSIDGSAFVKKIDDKKNDDDVAVISAKPSTLLPGLLRLLVGVISLAIHLPLSGHFQVRQLYNPEFIASNPIYYRIVYAYLALTADRFKYYFAWKVAEGASILGGFGFEGYDADGKELGWKGVENIEIITFETAPNIQTLSRAWNKRTQGWLERYTYHRTNKSLLATYFVSAIWHGLYPGFFLFFLTVPILTNIERLVKAKINPLIVPGYDGFNNKTYPDTFIAKVYWFVCWVFVTIFIAYTVQPFSMGSFQNSYTCLAGYYGIPHGVMIVAYTLLELLPSPRKKSTTAAAVKKEE
eukprot:gene9308-12542_t